MEPRDLRMCTAAFASWTAPRHLHTLRHTAATLLLAEGEHPKVVQELLGHGQVSITLDRYSHMTPRLMSNTVALMDWLLDGEEPVRQLLTALATAAGRSRCASAVVTTLSG